MNSISNIVNTEIHITSEFHHGDNNPYAVLKIDAREVVDITEATHLVFSVASNRLPVVTSYLKVLYEEVEKVDCLPELDTQELCRSGLEDYYQRSKTLHPEHQMIAPTSDCRYMVLRVTGMTSLNDHYLITGSIGEHTLTMLTTVKSGMRTVHDDLVMATDDWIVGVQRNKELECVYRDMFGSINLPDSGNQSPAIEQALVMGYDQTRPYGLMDQMAQNQTTVMLQTMGQRLMSLEQCVARLHRRPY